MPRRHAPPPATSPHRVATWLLKSFGPTEYDSVIGDLLEQYQLVADDPGIGGRFSPS
jgi:hypothetical protein